MSKKINVDPVLRLLESNHDFCDIKKEIKPTLQDYLEQIICYVLNIKKSHSGLCTKEIKKKIIFCRHFIDLKRHFSEL